jgi:hypothetical protein
MDGNVTAKGQKSDVDTDFSDIWDELNIAGMVTFDARKDNWGFLGDVIYADLGKSKSVGSIDIDPTVNSHPTRRFACVGCSAPRTWP